ncbi:TDT family transporter [Alkalibacter saccharofermentans]|uniref:Exfoliative toxin A/B n=1 Tax=Alkalibacter saccharofermentans DSM 14828 TaxID=1120975 RepID=A0A1M4U7Q0_9FIRM|nr:TDT family transporter [Alkalibacter saccharofermentans]SHE52802.1 exfoliative toxin A/B [Alkalibacter saccharofermentans DSM 14828]
MKNIINKIPIPISGLMLALASLGNLVGAYSQGLRYIFGSISAIILITLVLKLAMMPRSYMEGFSNPVIGCILATIPMGLMILSTYIIPVAQIAAYWIWMAALALNAVIILVFTKKHVLSFDIKKVFPSYFVLYVGIAVGSVTAPAYGMNSLGKVIFWYALAAYIAWFPIVTYRILRYRELPDQIKPVVVIYAAPGSLLLAGYLSVFQDKSVNVVLIIGVWAFIMTLFGVSKMPKLLKMPFYPSCSAFTFPFVISAMAFSSMTGFLRTSGYAVVFLEPINILMVAWAFIMVFFVLIRFSIFLLNETALTPYMEKRRRQ